MKSLVKVSAYLRKITYMRARTLTRFSSPEIRKVIRRGEIKIEILWIARAAEKEANGCILT